MYLIAQPHRWKKHLDLILVIWDKFGERTVVARQVDTAYYSTQQGANKQLRTDQQTSATYESAGIPCARLGRTQHGLAKGRDSM